MNLASKLIDSDILCLLHVDSAPVVYASAACKDAMGPKTTSHISFFPAEDLTCPRPDLDRNQRQL